MNLENKIEDIVRDYYGKKLNDNSDLKTTACCDVSEKSSIYNSFISNINPEVISKYYGCGLVVPQGIEGLKVLDLGCGSGRDVYLLSQLVGPHGSVIGVDITQEQLNTARKYCNYHQEKFGFRNFDFKFGNIENLDKLDLEKQSFDLIVSNCVINLCNDKYKVLNNIKELLKFGGEFYFSDVYSDRRIPAELAKNEILYGECLSGALYWNDFLRMAKSAGFPDPRLVDSNKIEITDNNLVELVKEINFYSSTYRLFNVDCLEDCSEDYGQSVIYKDSLNLQLDEFILDKDNKFKKDVNTRVCGNTFNLIKNSRFRKNFELIDDNSFHRGIFYLKDKGDFPFNLSKSNDKKGCC